MNRAAQNTRHDVEIAASLPARPAQEALQRSQVLETPALSYRLSQTRLLAKLLSAPSEECGLDLRRSLAVPGVEEVLRHEKITTTIRGAAPELILELRYLAHIHNATLGTSFIVVDCGDAVRLCNDGAVRHFFEDDRREEPGFPRHSARHWNAHELVKVLQELPQKHPHLERLLECAVPQGGISVTPASLVRQQLPYVRDIVVPTANRPDDVRRLLRSLATSFDFYGYPTGSIRIRIIDTSTAHEQQAKTKAAVAWACQKGMSVEYVGPAEIRAEMLRIRDQLPEKARKPFSTVFLRGLFSESGTDGVPLTIGTIRNAISLLMRDTPHISLDDDMMLHAPIPSLREYQQRWERCQRRPLSYDLNAGCLTDYARMDERASNQERSDFEWLPTDIVGIVNRSLASPSKDNESRIVGIPTESRFVDPEPRVAVVRSYLAGATPDVTTFFRRFIQSEDERELTGERAPYGLPIDVPAATLYRGYSSGTMFAVSSGLGVPFMDARAYEDVAQSQLGHLLFNGDLQHQAGVVEHRRHVGSRVINSDQYIDCLLGFHMMHRYLSSVRTDSVVVQSKARDRVKLFRDLGRKLWEDAQGDAISRSDLDLLIRGYQEMAASLRSAKVGGADTFLHAPEEIGAAITRRLKVMQRANGLLYFNWPDICAAAGQL